MWFVLGDLLFNRLGEPDVASALFDAEIDSVGPQTIRPALFDPARFVRSKDVLSFTHRLLRFRVETLRPYAGVTVLARAEVQDFPVG